MMKKKLCLPCACFFLCACLLSGCLGPKVTATLYAPMESERTLIEVYRPTRDNYSIKERVERALRNQGYEVVDSVPRKDRSKALLLTVNSSTKSDTYGNAEMSRFEAKLATYDTKKTLAVFENDRRGYANDIIRKFAEEFALTVPLPGGKHPPANQDKQ